VVASWESSGADPASLFFTAAATPPRYSIYAVFDSWESDRANVYRSINQIVGLKVRTPCSRLPPPAPPPSPVL